MNEVVSTPFPTLEAATEVVTRLRGRGVPERSIAIEDLTPAHGLNLGAGVLPDAMEAVIDQHEDEDAPMGYVVRVDTGGDVLNEAVAREVFGYVA